MKALGIVAIGLLMSLAASCEDEPLRMTVERPSVSAGEIVVVHFDVPKSLSGEDAWLTLVPLGGIESPVSRVLVPRGMRSATVSTREPGAFEVRLHAPRFPGRTQRVVARVRVDVAEPALAQRRPPVWFW